PPAARFRTDVKLVLVDVVVRDKSGAIVKGLSADDFQVLEDGKPQQILSFAFEEISSRAIAIETASVLSPVAGASATPRVIPPNAAARPAPAEGAAPTPLTSEDVAGHRLLTLLFDTSSMQPEDVHKAADAAIKWVDEQMTSADLVAVASIG